MAKQVKGIEGTQTAKRQEPRLTVIDEFLAKTNGILQEWAELAETLPKEDADVCPSP